MLRGVYFTIIPNSPPSKSHLKIIEILPKKLIKTAKKSKNRPKSKKPENPYKIGNLPKCFQNSSPLHKKLQIPPGGNGKICTPGHAVSKTQNSTKITEKICTYIILSYPNKHVWWKEINYQRFCFFK